MHFLETGIYVSTIVYIWAFKNVKKFSFFIAWTTKNYNYTRLFFCHRTMCVYSQHRVCGYFQSNLCHETSVPRHGATLIWQNKLKTVRTKNGGVQSIQSWTLIHENSEFSSTVSSFISALSCSWRDQIKPRQMYSYLVVCFPCCESFLFQNLSIFTTACLKCMCGGPKRFPVLYHSADYMFGSFGINGLILGCS